MIEGCWKDNWELLDACDKVGSMTMISLEMLGREALPLEGMYRRAHQDVLTPPHDRPESQNVRRNGSNGGNVANVATFDPAPRHEMHPLDQPAVDLGLPANLPEILYCKWGTVRISTEYRKERKLDSIVEVFT